MKSINIVLIFFLSASFLFSQETTDTPEPKGKVQVEIFTDYFYKLNGEAAPDSLYTGGEYQRIRNEAHGMAFRRFNLGYEYKFNDKFNARVMLEGNDGFTTSNGTRSVYIKYAFLEWNLFKSHNLVIGAQSTPTFATFSEKFWGYRMVEKTIIDYRRDGSSNDVGVSLNGNINNSGTLGYNLMVGNGTSTRVEDNNFKRIYGSVHGTVFDKKLAFQVYSDYEGDNNVDRYLLKAFLAYNHERLTVGAEPYNRITKDSTSSVTKSTFGLQVFARGSIIKDKLNAFARVDIYDGNTKVEDFYRETFVVFGVDYIPFKNINIIPNIWINSYNSEESTLPDRDSDVVARLTVRFKI